MNFRSLIMMVNSNSPPFSRHVGHVPGVVVTVDKRHNDNIQVGNHKAALFRQPDIAGGAETIACGDPLQISDKLVLDLVQLLTASMDDPGFQ